MGGRRYFYGTFGVIVAMWFLIAAFSHDFDNDAGTAFLITVWLLSAMIGSAIAREKGRAGEGWALGLLLGPIGWIVAAVMSPSAQVQAAATESQVALLAAALGQSVSDPSLVPCPWCAEKIQPAAVVCRYCSRDISPASWPPPSGNPAL